MQEAIPKTISLILQKFPVHKIYSKDVVVRCPYCGDSIKNTRSCHMYISKFPIDGVYRCHCFRCEKSIPLLNFLIDNDLIKHVPKEEIKKIYEADTTIPFSNLIVRKERSYRKVATQKFNEDNRKIQYIKNRIGDIPKQVKKYIITNFNFEENPKKREWLNRDFVGFTTYRRCKVICRNISDHEQRYLNCNLDMTEDYFLFYDKNLKLLDTGIIFIAEGIFSLLGAYNFLKRNGKLPGNSIYVASAGKSSITSCLRYVMALFGVADWNVTVIGDSEVDHTYYVRKVKSSGFFNMKIIYNKHGDDFGHPDVREVLEIIV